MVGVTELESVTSTMSTWRSNQLSYTPKKHCGGGIYIGGMKKQGGRTRFFPAFPASGHGPWKRRGFSSKSIDHLKNRHSVL